MIGEKAHLATMACSVDWQCIYQGAASFQKALKDGDFMAQCMLHSLTELYIIIESMACGS